MSSIYEDMLHLVAWYVNRIVPLFYMVSGFLITYVLNKSYSDTRAFYFNRALRIFPIYWIVAISIALFHLIEHTVFYNVFSQLPISANIFLTLSNIFIFGQDWILFFGVKNGSLVPVSHFLHSDVPLLWGLIIGPAWSLGVELTFYLIAPFVVRRPIRIIALFSASALLRAFLISKGFSSDPWSYRFFPTELALFMAGALACHYGFAIWSKKTARYSTILSITLLITYPFWQIDGSLKPIVLILAGPFLLPGLFLFQSTSSFDKALGELSYPIYICHFPIIQVLSFYSPNPHPVIVFIAVITTAFLLSKLVGQRLEKIRAKVRGGKISSDNRNQPSALEHPTCQRRKDVEPLGGRVQMGDSTASD